MLHLLKKSGFYIVLGLAHLVALLPAGLRYGIANGLAFFLHRILRYRHKVVESNIRRSFPDMSMAQRKLTAKQFYRNLADIILETIGMLHLSADEITKSIHFTNPEVFEDCFRKKQSVFVAIGHTGNWEWLAACLSLTLRHQTTAIYKKLSDDRFDGLMKKLRQRHGRLHLVESKAAYRYLASQKDVLHAVLILGDQTPQNKDTNYWTSFLNQDTPFFTGLEKMANALDFAVVYLDFYRVGRGRYRATASIISEEDALNSSITEQYARRLERSIMERPDNWLWSHKRWKHKRHGISL